MTTSDLIKAHIQPVTVPPGWTVVPELTNQEHSWYTHHYIDEEAGEERVKDGGGGQPDPPPGTFSFCARLAADPATAHFIGKPTHFLSHAHTMDVQETLSSVRHYVSKLPPEEVSRMYWWIDGFAIDQHECQYSPPSVDDNSAAWAQTFQQAIAKMGNVVMVLNPWHDPLVLSRLWCLWELHCAVATGSSFRICMSPSQETAFRNALHKSGGKAAMLTLSSVDVTAAKGHPKDMELIMGGIRASPGGTEGLNRTAVGQLRESFVGQLAREWLASLRSVDGDFIVQLPPETPAGVFLSFHKSRDMADLADYRDGAANGTSVKAVSQTEEWVEVHPGGRWLPKHYMAPPYVGWPVLRTSTAGALDTLMAVEAGHQVADLLGSQLGHWEEARDLLIEVVAGFTRLDGPNAANTLAATGNLAGAMKHTAQVPEAKELLEELLAKEIAKYGLESRQVLNTQHSLASLLMARVTDIRMTGKRQDYESALELFDAVVAGHTKLLGPDHEDTLLGRMQRASSLSSLGRHGEARAEYEAVLAGQRALPQLGPRHPTTVFTQHRLAILLHGEPGEREQAEGLRLMREVAEVRATVLGEQHPDTQLSVGSVEEWERALDPEHASSLSVGAVVTFAATGSLRDQLVNAMGGAVGEIIEKFEEDGQVGVRFPVGLGRIGVESLMVATPEQAAQWEATKATLDTQEAAQHQQDLPLVREIFALFDADADGRLSQAEYKNFLRGVAAWGDAPYTDDQYDDEGWQRDCGLTASSPAEGITKEAFETSLYGKYRKGRAQTDLESCKRSAEAPQQQQQAVRRGGGGGGGGGGGARQDDDDGDELAAALAMSMMIQPDGTDTSGTRLDEAMVAELMSWGFEESAVRVALEAAAGDKEAAVNMLLG